jgi:hypothetical protein
MGMKPKKNPRSFVSRPQHRVLEIKLQFHLPNFLHYLRLSHKPIFHQYP